MDEHQADGCLLMGFLTLLVLVASLAWLCLMRTEDLPPPFPGLSP